MSKMSVTVCGPTDSHDNTEPTFLKQVAQVLLMFTVKSKTYKEFEIK